MPRRALTDRFCQHAKAADGEAQTDYFDEDTPGLAQRVTKAAARSWTYHFTLASRRVRMTFGTYPALSLAQARTKAAEARAELEAGRDPRTALAAPETLRAVCEEWATREAADLRTGERRKATLERLVYPTLGDRPIGDIRRSEIVRLLDGIADTNGPVAADAVLAFIRRVCNWHASRSDDFRSPIVRGMARTKPQARARKRILTDDEIRDVWTALRTANVPACYPRFIKTLLLTATRRNEAADMHKHELEADAIWTIPGERYKTKLDHVVPLTAAAQALIGERAKLTGFVFSTTNGAKPIHTLAEAKAELDRQIAAIRRAEGREPMAPWRLHDLRRTARSLMSRAGVPSDHADRVLGHVLGGIRGTYDRYECLTEKAAALRALAVLVAQIIAGPPKANAVPMLPQAADA
jgi:integrase